METNNRTSKELLKRLRGPRYVSDHSAENGRRWSAAPTNEMEAADEIERLQTRVKFLQEWKDACEETIQRERASAEPSATPFAWVRDDRPEGAPLISYRPDRPNVPGADAWFPVYRASEPPDDGPSLQQRYNDLCLRLDVTTRALNTAGLAQGPLATLDRMLQAKGLQKERELCQKAFGYVAAPYLRAAETKTGDHSNG